MCTKAGQKLILRVFSPIDDSSRDGFIEMRTHNLEKVLWIPTKTNEIEIFFQNRFKALTEKLSKPQQRTSSHSTSQNFNNLKNWRGNSRGHFNQKSGNRWYYNNQVSKGYQNQKSKSRKIREQFRGNNISRRDNHRRNNRGNYAKNEDRVFFSTIW